MSSPASDALILTGSGKPLAPLRGEGLLAVHRDRAGERWVALLSTDPRTAEDLVASLRAAGADLHRAALARIQRGLDLWEPAGPTRRAIGIVEYVRSEPATRDAYYRSQYEVSGPAMTELWRRGLVQRFVGAEVVSELLEPAEDGAAWDVLHLTEFPFAALPRMLSWTRLFDARARAAGHASMSELKREWGAQRSMVKSRARIRQLAS